MTPDEFVAWLENKLRNEGNSEEVCREIRNILATVKGDYLTKAYQEKLKGVLPSC